MNGAISRGSEDPAAFDRLKATWTELGARDPLWAVATRDETRGGRWRIEDFFATGEADVATYARLLRQGDAGREPFDHVLDFGCGVGRLTLAWSRRARQVTGVDVSPGMIEKGTALLAHLPNARLVLNPHPDLRLFDDEAFDLVASHICLQHIPWPIAAGYVREFARVVRRGGWVAFQLPASLRRRWTAAAVRQRLVEAIPFGLGGLYRRWRRGYASLFEMHYTPRDQVLALARSAGLEALIQEPDASAGPDVESYIYVFVRGPRSLIAWPTASDGGHRPADGWRRGLGAT